jgi:hypothetical protein
MKLKHASLFSGIGGPEVAAAMLGWDNVFHCEITTPSSRDWKGKTNPGIVKAGSGCKYGETLPDTVGRVCTPTQDGQTFRLSPLFTEEMMGFPFLWTTLPFLKQNGASSPSRLTETPSSPKSCIESSKQ